MSKAFKKLVEDVWVRSPGANSYVAPLSVVYALKQAHPMFRGFQQHDSQEFLRFEHPGIFLSNPLVITNLFRCFMDLLHKELMEPIQDNSNDEEDDGDDHEDQVEEPNSNVGSPSLPGSPISSDQVRDCLFFIHFYLL